MTAASVVEGSTPEALPGGHRHSGKPKRKPNPMYPNAPGIAFVDTAKRMTKPAFPKSLDLRAFRG
jgi:hypothetical protein